MNFLVILCFFVVFLVGIFLLEKVFNKSVHHFDFKKEFIVETIIGAFLLLVVAPISIFSLLLLFGQESSLLNIFASFLGVWLASFFFQYKEYLHKFGDNYHYHLHFYTYDNINLSMIKKAMPNELWQQIMDFCSRNKLLDGNVVWFNNSERKMDNKPEIQVTGNSIIISAPSNYSSKNSFTNPRYQKMAQRFLDFAKDKIRRMGYNHEELIIEEVRGKNKVVFYFPDNYDFSGLSEWAEPDSEFVLSIHGDNYEVKIAIYRGAIEAVFILTPENAVKQYNLARDLYFSFQSQYPINIIFDTQNLFEYTGDDREWSGRERFAWITNWSRNKNKVICNFPKIVRPLFMMIFGDFESADFLSLIEPRKVALTLEEKNSLVNRYNYWLLKMNSDSGMIVGRYLTVLKSGEILFSESAAGHICFGAIVPLLLKINECEDPMCKKIRKRSGIKD